MTILELIEDTGLTPKREAATYGGVFSSPCPFCQDGDDRFVIWPNRHNNNGEYQGGRYWCRVCGKHGDAITFIRELHGVSYREACNRLKIEPKKINSTQPIRQERKPLIVSDPSEVWQGRAKAFVDWCHTNLISNSDAIALVTKRGFTLESIKRFKLGFNPKDLFGNRTEWGLEEEIKDDGKPRKMWLPTGLIIPTFSENGNVIKVKIRRLNWKEGDKYPKYVELSGSKQCFSIYGDTSLPCALVLESEFDALLVQQFASDILYCVALGGSTKPIDQQTDLLLRTTSTLLFCPDFDEAGAVAWKKWKNMFLNIHRVMTPLGKSPGDDYLAGIDLREWLLEYLNYIEVKSNKENA